MPKRRHTEEERSVLAHDWLELAEHRSEIADEKLPEDRPDLLGLLPVEVLADAARKEPTRPIASRICSRQRRAAIDLSKVPIFGQKSFRQNS